MWKEYYTDGVTSGRIRFIFVPVLVVSVIGAAPIKNSALNVDGT